MEHFLQAVLAFAVHQHQEVVAVLNGNGSFGIFMHGSLPFENFDHADQYYVALFFQIKESLVVWHPDERIAPRDQILLHVIFMVLVRKGNDFIQTAGQLHL